MLQQLLNSMVRIDEENVFSMYGCYGGDVRFGRVKINGRVDTRIEVA